MSRPLTGLERPWVAGIGFFLLFVVFGTTLRLILGNESIGESLLGSAVPGAIAAPIWVFVMRRRLAPEK